MTYLFYGSIDYLINEEINKIIAKYKIDDISISRYNMEKDSIDDILEDASTVSLFSNQKLVIVTNAVIFTNQAKKSNINTIDEEKISNYLNNMNPLVQLVFINDKVNMVKKLSKLIKKVGVVKEFNEVTNLKKMAKELLSGYSISDSTINVLLDRVNNNIDILRQECIKLSNYKLEEKEITLDDVKNMVNKNIELDIFKLIDDIVTKNKEEAMEIYEEMLKHNEEPIKIIIMLSNQFRLMFQSKKLIKKGYSEKEIAKKLNVHPYPVKLALQKSRNYDESRLLFLLSELADLDFQIKSGEIEKRLGLELFILSL